jgi:probable HAF family extracellular repeat protein
MPNGSYWVGRGGFTYKRSGGGGARRNFPLGLITNQPADVNNTYVPGAGVGASSRATRRAKMLHATLNTPQYPYNRMFSRLGLQASGGSNDYAYNWYFNDVWPNPYPFYRSIAKTLKYIILPGLNTGDGYGTQANATSDDGSIIVGFSEDSNGNTVAVRWVNGAIQNLGTLPGDTSSSAYFCSSDGSIIIGTSTSNSAVSHAVKWVNGVISELSPGTISSAYGCSADGSIIVGNYQGTPQKACVWINGTRTDLDGLTGNNWANDCSTDGSIIVGQGSDNGALNTYYALKWVKNGNSYGSYTQLDLLPGKNNANLAECSNNGTVIVGTCISGNDILNTSAATSWVNNSPINLGTLAGYVSSTATGCSTDGSIIVGTSIGFNNGVSYSTAVKWTNASITSLGIPLGYVSTNAQACSLDGSIIVGFAAVNTFTTSAIKWYYE